ncbi:MAG: hypothetical protein DSZ32_03345 [Gammaproteobacteria bacterium]|nr:MAG: hypothetical protein DSZ32_03345 [Gammaproteobacteria bacterium]
MKRITQALSLVGMLMLAIGVNMAQAGETKNYDEARWDPIHFKPAIETATDEQCLACHQDILERKVREETPAGLKKDQTLAWYQTLNTYEGPQVTFHKRHLKMPYAQKVMQLKCNTCHQGNDPREEVPGSSATAQVDLTMRKMVDPMVCLMCHGQFPWKHMTGLTGPWPESGKLFANNCMACHAAFRTNRHKVNFLKPEAIEELGKKDGDVCYGCHGGRAWYRTSFPYPRHAWTGMAKETPEWAKGRPTESEKRFMVDVKK